ncbi:DMT family transporter [Candidatus Babeliales bacterium]|nr:DMT family transporter [Candidatus Babeliales bacterium]
MLQISSPIFAAGVRTLIGGLVLTCYSFGTKKQGFVNKKDLWVLFQIAIFNVVFSAIFKNLALKNMTSIKAGFFGNLDPFMAALFAYAIFSEKLTKRRWFGMFVAFSGALVYLFSSSPTEKAIGEIAFISLPELSIIFALASARLGWFKIQYLVRDRYFEPTFIVGVSMASGGLLTLLLSFFLESTPRILNFNLFALYMSYIVLSSNIIGYVLYAYLHKIHSGTLIALLGFSQPLFVALYGIVFLKEPITWLYFISTILVFIGVGIFYKDELNRLKK